MGPAMRDTTSAAVRSERAGRFRGFHELMRWRVQHVLLVSSLYDSFMLAEDDPLSEVVLAEFLGLDLQHIPDITHVASGAEAVALARRDRRYNLVVASPHVADMDAGRLVAALREAGVDTPVVLLAYDQRELAGILGRYGSQGFVRAFLWQGDAHILVAIVKLVEDQMNVAHDTGRLGVQAVLVVEDSVRFYSSFLPLIYRELFEQARRLVPEGLNVAHKLMRIQARPKILLATSFEEAWHVFSTYQEHVLGVISDIEVPRDGMPWPQAGLELARRVRELQPDVPVVLQSAVAENEALAHGAGAAFLLKGSPTLLADLRRLLVETFGFGDFVFRLPDGREVGRAADLRGLEGALATVPAESIAYHAARNHFSRWLKARTEFALAEALRPRRVSDFPTVEHLREDLIRAIRDYRAQRSSGVIADFRPESFDAATRFARIGSGSLGGKARGLAFVNRLLLEADLSARFPGVRVFVPTTVVVATDVFDEFLHAGGLRDFALTTGDDQAIVRRFLETPLPAGVVADLARFLERATWPLAVRSSSLLEDSQYQPFAGVYETYMLANTARDPQVRLAALAEAIRRVYASTFSQRAKSYLEATDYRLEEEKMAVVLQRLVGTPRGWRFYPDIAGVARSYNFYPVAPMRAEDGIAAVALGFGATVVDGELCVRFCPRYPRHPLPFSSARDLLRNSQRDFHVLRLTGPGSPAPSGALERCPLDEAERDGVLRWVGSTYSRENDAVYDGIARVGPRLVTFAPILKQDVVALAPVLDALLALGVRGTGAPVEIEFAATLPAGAGRPAELGFLQLRPLALRRDGTALDIDGFPAEGLLCRSHAVLGNGQIDDIHDVIVVDVHRFERAKSRDVARAVAGFNSTLLAERRPYLLVGVGRWGSNDPLLGIPVTWPQISGARAIVEAGFRDMKVAPSQGTHFFQNLVSQSVGYFTVNPEAGEGFIDWSWLAAQPAVAETASVRHLRFDEPVVVRMDGRRAAGVILKPGGRSA
jgi:CheY-like chemotaxis protein